MATKRKVVRSTQTQLRLLVEHMSANRLFALGEFSGPLGAQNMEAEWAKLRDLLAEHGPPKTVDQWKHSWRDLKKKAREEGAKACVAHGATGNHVLIPEVSEMSKIILDTIGRESAQGLSMEEESGIGEFIVLPESAPWMSPSPLPDTNADSTTSLCSPPRLATSPSPRPIADASPFPVPGPSARPVPVPWPRPTPGPWLRSATGLRPRPAPGPSRHPTPCPRPRHALGPSPHTALGPSPHTAPGPSPHRASGPAFRPTHCPTPTPPSPVTPSPPGTPDTPLQQAPTPQRPRARPRRRQARAMDSATRPTAQFIAQQNQLILHMQELVEEQRVHNCMLRMQIKRARLFKNTALNNLRF